MDDTAKVLRDIEIATARSVILEDFPRLVHDVDCDCEAACRAGALAALVLADWSIADATQAWLEARGYVQP